MSKMTTIISSTTSDIAGAATQISNEISIDNNLIERKYIYGGAEIVVFKNSLQSVLKGLYLLKAFPKDAEVTYEWFDSKADACASKDLGLVDEYKSQFWYLREKESNRMSREGRKFTVSSQELL